MAEKKLTYKEKSSITFVEQDEPAFIKEMKKKLGYKEPHKLEDKFGEKSGINEAEDTESELERLKREDGPQIVVLNPETDLSQDEVKKALEAKEKEEDEQKIAEGKIVFKKPVKRGAEETTKIEEKKKREEEKYREPVKPQRQLLSFGDEEEEDEE